MNESFSREERIRKRGDFLRISDSGTRLSTAHFIVLWQQSGHAHARLGVTVSRKVGNAVIRNRVKRLLREFFRLHKELFPVADVNIIGRRGADRLPYHALCAEIGKALQSIRNRTCSSGF